MWRALHPEDYDQSKLLARLEQIAVILVRTQMMMGNQSEVTAEELPQRFEDLFDKKKGDGPELLSLEEIDARMGWKHDQVELTPQELLSFEEIDKRMGRADG